MVTTYKEAVPFLRNPRSYFQTHHHDLSCFMYAQQLKQVQDNRQMYTQKDHLNSPFNL